MAQDEHVKASREQLMLEWLDSQHQAMIDHLQRIVDIDSGSYDKPGIDAVGAVVRDFLEEAGLQCETIEMPENGNIVRGIVPSYGGANGNILLMGHLDTVFPAGEAAKRPFEIRNGRGYGPGCADMKAGIVMNCFVAAAFARFGGAPGPIVVLCTGDEEIASPASSDTIIREAKAARFVLNAEPGRANGNVVTERRACMFIELQVRGRAAHSGVNFADGASAIEQLARHIIGLHKLTDLSRLISVNVGLISGGQSVNTIAPDARASIDIRYRDPTDRGPLIASVRDIVDTCTVEGVTAQMRIYGEFPPLSASEGSSKLFKAYQDASKSLGLNIEGELTHGAADSGFAAAAGAATVCGLGPIGGKYHSSDEYVEIDSLVSRSKALALAVMRL